MSSKKERWTVQNKENIKQFIELLAKVKLIVPVMTVLIIYFVIMVLAFFLQPFIGLLLLILLGVIWLFGSRHFRQYLQHLEQELSTVSPKIRMAQEDSLYQSPIAVLLYNEHKQIRWLNPALQQIFGTQLLLGKPLEQVEANFAEVLSFDATKWQPIQIGDHYYKALHQPSYQAIYLIDVTKEQQMLALREYDKIVFGYLSIDDYDELVQSMDDSEESHFDAQLLSQLRNWAHEYHLYLKRLDNEKFVLLANQKGLERLEKDKFKALEAIKEKNYMQNIPVSFSLGIAYAETSTYELDELATQAQWNLDLALGRGGDQTVVKAQTSKARFYGGKMSTTEKRTTTRSKLVYQALVTSIEQADAIFIAGHRYPDLDALASALGIHKIVAQHNKQARIILNPNELHDDVAQLLNFPAIQKEAANLFVTQETAATMMTENSLIIMVDHHRPSLSSAGDLVLTHEVVVIDHHRRSEDFPPNSVLTFIEPYASSTAELITEFFIYMRNTHEMLNKTEATALLAGIIVDTNNFTTRTGSRTFDAASYLKSRGANMQQIQQLLKEEFSRVQQRNELVDRMEFVQPNLAVVQADERKVYDNVIASQAADTLLTLKHIEASFVIFKRQDGNIGISARSLGNLNVQTIMEQLGGGGHLSTAATQIKDSTIELVYQDLMTILQQLKEE